MKPYYQDDLVTLYLADCLPAIQEMPDKAFDLAIVDPQYGKQCNLKGGSSRHGSHGWSKVFAKVDDWNDMPLDPDYFTELHRISGDQIILGGNYFANLLPPSQGWIFWDKVQRSFSLAHGELAWTSFNRALQVFTYARGNESGFAPALPDYQKQDANIHPTQKPVALYRWLLKNYAKPGDKIFDSHMGSQSSRIACWDGGFDFWGCELDKDYYDAGCKRFENYKLQLKLF